MNIKIGLKFVKGYIASPYWPELQKLIDIQKSSGMKRARSDDKRDKALKSFLDSQKMSMEEYRSLEKSAARPFYMSGNEIVIPAHHLYGMCAQGCDLAPSNIRISSPEQVRTLITISDFSTGKKKLDGIWERFVVVKTGTGQTLSNQRGLRSDAYIENFEAHGTLRIVNDEMEKRVRQFFDWVGREIGVGASRKLGWGRFVVSKWQGNR